MQKALFAVVQDRWGERADNSISGCSKHFYISVGQGGDFGVPSAGQEGGGQPSEEIGRRLVMSGSLGRLV